MLRAAARASCGRESARASRSVGSDRTIAPSLAAVGMGVASRTLLDRAKGNPQFFGALSSIRFIPQTGAVVIKDLAGNVLGAAGASGGTGDEDEEVCIAGVEAAGLMHG